jgi:hypothetical protein
MDYMLLIYPPAARSTEPPLGIARLASFLKKGGKEAMCLDLCREGIDYLLGLALPNEGLNTWTRGALKRRESSVETICDISSYGSMDRYGRAVRDLDKALRTLSAPSGAQSSLADYRDESRSPLSRDDLFDSAKHFEANAFYPLFDNRLPPLLRASVDGWVGVSINFLSQALCAFALIGYIKAKQPKARIAIGGGLVTSWMANSKLDLTRYFEGLIDASFQGPGEEGLARLFDLEPRLGTKPDFGDFESLRYFAPKPILPYNFSWGCPWKRCSFCPETTEDLPYRGLRAEEACADLDALADIRSPGLFHFTDNEVSPLYLAMMASSSRAIRNPIPWYGFARFSARLLDPDFCHALAASGCVMLQFGLESGDQELLDRIGKGTRLEEIETILANLKSASIGVYAYILFGTPSEDGASALRTRDFVAAHADEIAFLNVAIFNLPQAGTEARGLSTRPYHEGELSLYREFEHPRGWNRSEVRRFLKEDFESSNAIRSILSRSPPIFTSSHAPFFCAHDSFARS